ncbi:MAG: hypothetical protein JXA54_16220 [Candidatus Heimdallarchaeota archaeon]|nr:hypothetical protein [Candidatus Heimdallarchaeota archaeon]
MSEEDYYIDILKEEENDDPKRKRDDWDTESRQSEYIQSEPYKQDYEGEPYQQEFYGDGYYQDYQNQQRPIRAPPTKERGRKWFWLGVLIASGISAITMLIFNFIGTATSPGLAFLEVIILLACCTLPGLFVRKVGKGILGGMLIFGLQFFLPIAIFYGMNKDPTSFFSPYYLFLNSIGMILNGYEDFKTFSFLPFDPAVFDTIDQYTKYAAFVWVFDLLIMFGIMLTLVIASSWLFRNLFTEKAKSFWTWCLVPGQAIVIILNLIIIPWILLCLTSTVQTGGALAAGAANIADSALPLVGGNFSTSFSDMDFDALLANFDKADEWFSIAHDNYNGLSSLRFFKLLQAVSGKYAFTVDIFNLTISAGFELLAALSPLAHGLFDNTTTNPDAQVDGFYYQYTKFMNIYSYFPSMFDFSSNTSKPTETDLANMEVEVNEIIDDVDLLLDLHFREVLDHILIAEEILFSIDTTQMRNIGGIAQVDDVFNQIADQLDMVMNITKEYSALIPIAVDLLFETPHLLRGLFDLLVGNIRLLMGFQFDECRIYLNNATLELGYIQDIFTSARRAEIVSSGSASALGFFDFFNDTLNLVIPIVALEGNMAGTLGGTIDALDEYVDPITEICDLSATNFTAVFDYMNEAINEANDGIFVASVAQDMLTIMQIKGNNTEYSLMSGAASMITSTVNSVFQPEPIALVLANFTRAINATFASTYYIYNNDEPETVAELNIASLNIDDAVAVIDSYNGTPIYAMRDFLVTFKTSIDDIVTAITPYLGFGTLNLAVPEIESIMKLLWENIHNIIDVGLAP